MSSRKSTYGTLLLLIVVSAFLTALLLNSARSVDTRTVFLEAVNPLKGWQQSGFRYRNWVDQEGWWVADVTELYRHEVITRRVAEADTSPKEPLIDRPRAFHGYFVRAMESGPDASLKGNIKSKESFAFCIYPAEAERRDLPVWIVCPLGIFMKQNDGNVPIKDWPVGKWRQDWAIVD